MAAASAQCPMAVINTPDAIRIQISGVELREQRRDNASSLLPRAAVRAAWST
jgi:hypothetical protein